MPRTRVKICGITRPDDARQAAWFGADALGLVFYPPSKRAVSPAQAAVIVSVTPVFVSMIGLFVNPDKKDVRDALRQVRLDCLQFHGDEDAAFCESFGLPYMKAVRVKPGQDGLAADPLQEASAHPNASAILLDAFDARQAGGTGKQFDWTVARRCVEQCNVPVVLAGGLKAANVAQAITQVRPWALDLSSGVESEPGLKDPEKLQEFFKEVNRVCI
ncbi:phosphoribosylanthranilate isomerase [Pseudohongiella spirulinae]|uniref:N-(5'-phosphoribosyl)anthranilate isomerase n=1 Tax=Pseudohongiella spirulinae TaxID=1249552 RepID=A0A0S2KEH5_9GAMM|nr:N-(5'-phosphoribosyl)anthranilate isomerase [Pseudohongiella spirulinae]